MSEARTVNVSLLDKDYQVSCPPGEELALQRAAQRLDQQMRDIRAGGKIIGLERITIMAALNLSYSLQAAETQLEETQKARQGDVDRLAERVGQALGQLRQLKLN